MSSDFVIRLRLLYREASTGELSEQDEVIHAVPGMFVEVQPPPGHEVLRAMAACEMAASAR